MSTKPQRSPTGLGPDGVALWRSITRQVAGDGLALDARELHLLQAACREADQLAQIESALDGEPMTVRGAQGQLVGHPLLGEARRSRTTIASLLKMIGLEDPLTATKGSGSRTTSWQARDAANARHRGA